MRILITNDDGIRAPGIAALVRVAKQFGEVKVAAPTEQQSGCGHGMTLHDPLRAKPYEELGVEAYMVNGVPVDCVNVGLTLLWPDGCDLILSGINDGPNLGFDVTYSGTVGGALEGAINGIQSIAVSMASFVSGAPVRFDTAERWLAENLARLIEYRLEPRTLLNVNVPNIDFVELRGTRVARMGDRVYEDRVELRHDPWGRPYYWQGGVVVMNAEDPDTDVYWAAQQFVSITPVKVDWTDVRQLSTLEAHLSGAKV
jgi:5'-nucleotidase